MRITFLLPSLAGGGAEYAQIRLANRLAKEGGNEVKIMAIGKERRLEYSVSKDVVVQRCKKERAAIAFMDIRKGLMKKNTDYFVSSLTHLNIASMLAWLTLGRARRCKIILSERNHLASSLESMPWLKRSIYRFLVRRLYGYADCLYAVSDQAAWSVRVVSGYPARSIYNGYESKEGIRNIQEERTKSDNAFRVVMVGRLEEHKGILEAVKAIRVLKDRYGGSEERVIELHIYGIGPLASRVIEENQDLIRDKRLVLMGFEKDIQQKIRDYDLLVLASKREGLPGVVVEALRSDIAIVSTMCPSGPVEILEGGRYGILIPSNSPAMIASAIITVVRNRWLCLYDRKRTRDRFTIGAAKAGFDRMIHDIESSDRR